MYIKLNSAYKLNKLHMEDTQFQPMVDKPRKIYSENVAGASSIQGFLKLLPVLPFSL